MSKRTKKNIHNQVMIPKVTSQKRNKDTNKNSKDLIEALLNKKNPKQSIINKLSLNKESTINKQPNKIIENFHKAIKLTNSDEIILKMLDLKEKDIIIFYKNMEKMIGKDLSHQIRQNIPKQLVSNNTIVNKNGVSLSLCPLCENNKSNCVNLLCGHLVCNMCAKNINRCKYPCPKCKKPIKYIQFISN